MIACNCPWEIENLGKRTIEIKIDEEDSFDSNRISEITKGYEYSVVKVPMNKPDFNIGLTSLGFVCIETQLNVFISYQNFEFSKCSHLINDTDYAKIESTDDLQILLGLITPGMFSTDRISLDPCFGQDLGCQRYRNWISREFKAGRAELFHVLYQEEHVGFMLIRIVGDVLELLLNGLYKPFQKRGLGLLTPASPMMYIKKMGLNLQCEKTSISSNNAPVVKLYNRLNFQLESQKYVFIKHVS